MIILAIDPGTRESGLVALDTSAYRIGDFSGATWAGSPAVLGNLYDNEDVLARLRGPSAHDAYVIEMKQYYGKGSSAGSETFESCVWIGRFMEAIEAKGDRTVHRITRTAIRACICGTNRSSDKEVRQALIDRFGGDSVALKGKKCPKCKGGGVRTTSLPPRRGPCPDCDGSGWVRKPGPLAGITSHMWAALAVAVTWAETHKEGS